MSYSLTIEPIGETIEVEPGQTILDASLRAGLCLPHACGHGLCGSCKVDVVEGEVDHGAASSFALLDFERQEGKALACTATLSSDVTIEADLDEDEDARRIPVADFSGTIAALEPLTADVLRVDIALGGPGIDFQAGQYINLHVPGVDGPRAFSLANAPSEPNRIELHVRLVPGGRATTWLHRQAQLGDSLKVTGPYGRFFLRKSSGLPMIFLAGGTGLSSPKSMILDLLGEGWRGPITLFHGVRRQADLYMRELFEALAASHGNFTYIPVLSDEPADSDWAGERGFVHEAAERRFHKNFEGHKAYLCGPPPMIEACLCALMQGRLFERDIYTERFLSAADADQGRVRSPVFRRL